MLTRPETAAVVDACAVLEAVSSCFADAGTVTYFEKLADSISKDGFIHGPTVELAWPEFLFAPGHRFRYQKQCHLHPVRITDTRWPGPEAESALVVLVPEAEVLVGACRIVHDPAAAAGVPNHITVLYLFMPRARIDTVVSGHLRSCFRQFAPFKFSLIQTRKFPGVLYLAPEPADGFRALSLAVWQAYPDYPPYGGKHPDIIPHLSVAAIADDERLHRVAEEFEATCRTGLPHHCRATGVALMHNLFGSWRVASIFRLHATGQGASEIDFT